MNPQPSEIDLNDPKVQQALAYFQKQLQQQQQQMPQMQQQQFPQMQQQQFPQMQQQIGRAHV